ncbi:hypothetical protein [Shewanella colwelliana]|uniref:hypothetical protein n=1 Tax=Shewanella colwelliana TaxID=23 RepID=UPI00048EFEDA|nr:hypothetical protein [Shewanella colwelliana]
MKIFYLILTLITFQALAFEDKGYVKTYDLNKNYYPLSTSSYDHFSVKAGTFFFGCNENGLHPWVIKHGEFTPQNLWKNNSEYINCSNISDIYQLSKDEVVFKISLVGDTFITDGTTQGTRRFDELDIIKENIKANKGSNYIAENILKIGESKYIYSLYDGTYLFDIKQNFSTRFHERANFYEAQKCTLWSKRVVCILGGKIYATDGTESGTKLIYEFESDKHYKLSDTNKKDEYVTITLLDDISKLVKINILTGESHTLYENKDYFFTPYKKVFHSENASYFIALAVNSMGSGELTYNLFKYNNNTKLTGFIHREKIENYYGDLSLYHIGQDILIKGYTSSEDYLYKFNSNNDSDIKRLTLSIDDTKVVYLGKSEKEVFFDSSFNKDTHIIVYSQEKGDIRDIFYGKGQLTSKNLIHDNKIFFAKPIQSDKLIGQGLHVLNNDTDTFDYVSSIDKGNRTVSSNTKLSSRNSQDVFAFGELDEKLKLREITKPGDTEINHVFFKASLMEGAEVLDETLPVEYPKYSSLSLANENDDVFYLLNGKINRYNNTSQTTTELVDYANLSFLELILADERRLISLTNQRKVKIIDTESNKIYLPSEVGLKDTTTGKCHDLVANIDLSSDSGDKLNFYKWDGNQYKLRESISIAYNLYTYIDSKNGRAYYSKYYPSQSTYSINYYDCKNGINQELYKTNENEHVSELHYPDGKIIFSTQEFTSNSSIALLRSIDLASKAITLLHDDFDKFRRDSMLYSNRETYYFEKDTNQIKLYSISNNTSTELSTLNNYYSSFTPSPITFYNDPNQWLFVPIGIVNGIFNMAIYMPEYDLWHTVKIPNVFEITNINDKGFYLNGHYYFTYKSNQFGDEFFTINQECLATKIGRGENCKNPYENRAPIMLDVVSPTLMANQYLYIPIRAWDEDMDKLTFSINQVPNWVKFNPDNGEIHGKIPSDWNTSVDNIIVSVSDGIDTISSQPFSINIRTEDGGDNTGAEGNGSNNEENTTTPDSSNSSSSSGGVMFIEILLLILTIMYRRNALIGSKLVTRDEC